MRNSIVNCMARRVSKGRLLHEEQQCELHGSIARGKGLSAGCY